MSLHLHTSFYNSMHLCSCLLPYLALPLLISRDYPYFVKSCVLYVISISIDLLSLSVMHSYTCISFRRHLISASLIEFQKSLFAIICGWICQIPSFVSIRCTTKRSWPSRLDLSLFSLKPTSKLSIFDRHAIPRRACTLRSLVYIKICSGLIPFMMYAAIHI